MPSEESGVNKQESTWQAAPVASSHSTGPFTPPPSANANERAGLSQSHSLIESRNVVITDGQFNHTHGHHTNLVININPSEGSLANSRSSSSNEIRHISTAQISGQSSQVDHERGQSQNFSQSREISFQKSNVIYERHLSLKGRGFPLCIPDPNRSLHLDYRRTGIRIGDVGIITHLGAFSFLFNICLPHNDPVNPRMLPEHFSPISPPIEATDIDNFVDFNNGSYLSSASVKRSQTGTAISDIVFESSASEGAILTMPRGARSEDLANLATFREYAAVNVANWYRFVNGPRGREAKNGDVRLVVGFDKTTSWGIATFANQTQQNSCRLKFGPAEGDSASTYTWSENSGVADVKAGPDSDRRNELRIDSDPPDVQFENQCLFVRTLNATLVDDVWADIHSSSGSIPVDPRNSQYPRVKNYSDSNRPHSNNPGNSSNFSPSQGAQSGTQRRLQGVDITSDKNPPIFVSGPVDSITVHPSKVLNDTLLEKIPTAKMVITSDDDWSSITQYDTFPDPHEFVANILASRDICQENGVVFLQPKKTINEISEGCTSVNHSQGSLPASDDPVILPLPRDPVTSRLAPRGPRPGVAKKRSLPLGEGTDSNVFTLAFARPPESLVTGRRSAMHKTPSNTLAKLDLNAEVPKLDLKNSDLRKLLALKRQLPLNRFTLNPPIPPESPVIRQRSTMHKTLSNILAPVKPGRASDLKAEVPKLDLKNSDLRKLAELGQGNGGSVIKVEHITTGTIMAMKIVLIDAKSSASVQKQILILRELQIMHNSKYIVSCFGSFVAEPNICICMEFMDKGSFNGIYKRIGAIDINVVCIVAHSVLEGLMYLYDVHRIIHRDIKPSNILCNSQGSIKLSDFGVSGELINPTLMGTLVYMSPERIQGAKYTIKSDIWSLGITLIELAYGRPPFSEPLTADEDDLSDLDEDDLSDLDEDDLSDLEEDYQNSFDSGDGHYSFASIKQEERRLSRQKTKQKTTGVNNQGEVASLSIIELMHRIVSEPSPRLGSQYDEEAQEFVDACLTKDPDERHTFRTLLEYRWMDEARDSNIDVAAWANTF